MQQAGGGSRRLLIRAARRSRWGTPLVSGWSRAASVARRSA